MASSPAAVRRQNCTPGQLTCTLRAHRAMLRSVSRMRLWPSLQARPAATGRSGGRGGGTGTSPPGGLAAAVGTARSRDTFEASCWLVGASTGEGGAPGWSGEPPARRTPLMDLTARNGGTASANRSGRKLVPKRRVLVLPHAAQNTLFEAHNVSKPLRKECREGDGGASAPGTASAAVLRL